MNPEPFLNLDRVIHEKGRLAIMSLLAASPQLSFTEIRDSLKMTDGIVTAHLRTLHDAGYVAFHVSQWVSIALIVIIFLIALVYARIRGPAHHVNPLTERAEEMLDGRER